MAKEINVHITTETDKQKVDEYGNAVEAAGKKVNEAGGHAEGLTGKMNLLGHAINSVKSYLLGFVSITALFTFFQKWLDYINAIAEAQKELVESTKSLDQASKSLASQANIMGVPGGVEAARQQILAIQTAGKLGSFELAEGIAVSAHSAFGTSGQLLTKGQLGIAGAAAGFAQRKNISPEGINQLLKVLSAMGVKNEEEAQWRIQQLSTVQQASKAKSFEEFITGGIQSVIPALAAGASPEMAMAQFASAMDVVPSSRLAAEKTKQVTAMMLRPEVAEAIGGGFADLPYDQKITAFSKWVSQSTPGQLMAAGLSPEQVGELLPLYKSEQLGRIGMFRELGAGTTGAQFRAEAAGWSQTTPGKIEAIEAETKRLGATATPEERMGQVLKNAGEAMWKRMEGSGETTYGYLDSVEKSRKTVWSPLEARLEALRNARYGKGTGLQKAFDFINDPELRGIQSYLAMNRPTLLDPITPADVGRANAMLEPLEKQAGITINYHNEMIFARPGVDPTPRVSPADIE